MTPGRKLELEARLQRLAKDLTIEALYELHDEKLPYLFGQMQDWGLTFQEQEAATLALRDFFGKVADGLARNWGYQQNPRVNLAEVNVAEDAEGEDEDAQAVPAVPETEVQAEALGDAHGSGDQVQKDLNE